MRRGFTAVELAVVLSISAVLTPLVYQTHRRFEQSGELARFHLDSALMLRDLREEARADGRCDARYELRESALWRSGCGVERVVATRVRTFEQRPEALVVTRFYAFSPDEERFDTLVVPREAR